LSRMFSLAYPRGPEPAGNVGAFRTFLLARSMNLTPRATGRVAKKKQQ
jgi:LysR family transcriptional regulator, transcriptional activator of the cysJI operon